jgi:hypothetical protein
MNDPILVGTALPVRACYVRSFESSPTFKELLLLSAGSSAKSSRYRFLFVRATTFVRGLILLHSGCQVSSDQDRHQRATSRVTCESQRSVNACDNLTEFWISVPQKSPDASAKVVQARLAVRRP